MPDTARCHTSRLLLVTCIVALLAGANPARAVDCSKAATNVETGICLNDALMDADRRMTNVYQSLVAQLPDDAKQALRQSQRQWIKRRGWCEHSDKPVSQCVLRETIDRTKILGGQPQSGPGTGSKMTPVFLAQRGDPTQYEVDATALRFDKAASAGERLFNTLVDKFLSEVPIGQPQEDSSSSATYSYQLSMAVPFASPAFISAKLVVYEFAGGAHGNSSTHNINVDLKSGKSAQLDDMFKPSAKSILVQSCFTQIQQAKKARRGSDSQGLYNSDERRQIVQDTISELVNWSFTAGGATVIFDPYAIGAYAEGRYKCTFELDLLQALMTPASPLTRSAARR